MNIQHQGNWRAATRILDRDVYECPLCFALTLDPMSHAEFHQWTGTEHPYTPRGRS